MEQKSFPETIKAERIVLKRHRIEWADKLYKVVDNNRGHLGQFLDWVDHTDSAADSKAFIEESRWLWKEYEKFNYAILYQDTEEFIGAIGLFNISWKHSHGEIGYWMSSSYQGRGLMGEAVRALTKEAFKIGFHRVEIRSRQDNKRSIAVARRCGFTEEAILRGARCVRNEYIDEVLLSRLSTDD